MRRVPAKEMQELVATRLKIYSGLDQEIEETPAGLDRSGFLGYDELRRAFEAVSVENEDETGIDAAEVVLMPAGALEDAAE